jgi:ribulose-5-phosphate 4-epimerase/fuculose-1-phosphate aldolase
MRRDGNCQGRRRPSSEWRFHRDLYATRPDAGAILHAHSPFATSLACLRRDIPPFHYMIARFGGDSVRCAGYATFGTQALSDAVLLAMTDRRACLLANHGMLVLGDDLQAGARPRHRTRSALRTVLARLPARSAGAARCRRDGDGARQVRQLRPAA